MSAVLRTLLAALACCALLTATATATPLLSPGDAAELAQSLAEATEEQGVCYEWNVSVDDDSGGPDGIDRGSSAGPDRPLGTAIGPDCERTVTLEGSVTYTCDSCESEDSSSVRVTSSFSGGPTTGDLDDLGLDGGSLKHEDGDVVLSNMVGALPIITASQGAAPPLEGDALTGPTGTAATDRASGSPSTPDWLRESWLALAVCLLAIAGGVWWLVTVLVADRRRGPRESRRPGLRQARPEPRAAVAGPSDAPAGPPSETQPTDPPAREDR